MNSLPPGILLVLGALLIPFLKGRTQKIYGLLLPLFSAAHMVYLPSDHLVQVQIFEYTLTPIRVDKLSLVWGYVFHIAALMCMVYQLHVKDKLQDVAGIMYAGAAIAAVFSGDMVSLFVFFAHDGGHRVKEAPWNMIVAMTMAAGLCVVIGLYPAPLYNLLPFDVRADASGTVWENYTASHIITSLQLVLFAALGFAVLYRNGWYPPELKALNVDTDIIYRKAVPICVRWMARIGRRVVEGIRIRISDDPWSIGTTALWSAVLLGIYLIMAYS